MNLQLDQRIALVTGASQGLGYATALQLSREGAQVAICSRNKARIHAAADAIRSETHHAVLPVIADITRPDDVQRLIDRVVEEYGGLDILVTNSSGPPSLAFEETTDEHWAITVNELLMSTVHLIQSALPHLRQSAAPSVLTVTSFAVKQPIPNLVLSNSVRLAVIGLTRTLALELGGDGIRFNSILPGFTETEHAYEILEVRARKNHTSVEEEVQKQAQSSPFGRLATPAEIGNVATFLVSPAASYVTGTIMGVDGGSYKGLL
jgi:3-oxoacyl-[acyl-carrier protein] reductase